MHGPKLAAVVQTLTDQLRSGAITVEQYQTALVGLTETAFAPSNPIAPVTVRAIKCPNCGAPAGEALSGRDGHTCESCGHYFTIERVNQEVQRLRDDVNRLMAQSGAPGGSSAVDAVSRAHIFREKILPILEREYNRGMEQWEDYRRHPLIRTSADWFLAETGRANPLDSARDRLAEFTRMAGKLGAPQVKEFATGGRGESRLRRMEASVNELILSANLRNRSAQLSEQGYSSAAKNLAALEDLYTARIEIAEEEPEREFLRAGLRRWEGASQLVETLQQIHSSRNFSGDAFLGAIESARRCYRDALDRASACGYSAIETIPWIRGVEREWSAAGVLGSLLQGFDRVNRQSQSLDFVEFQKKLYDFVEHAEVPADRAASIAWVLDQVCQSIEAHRGVLPLPRVNQWAWCEQVVESSRKKGGLFGGGSESVEMQERYWQPFWTAAVSYSASQGAVFRSGVEQTTVALLDATVTGQTLAELLAADCPFRFALGSAPSNPVADRLLSLPALFGPAEAEDRLAKFLSARPGFPNARVRMGQLVYLPVCRVAYRSKTGIRRDCVSLARMFNRDTARLCAATQNLISALEN